MMCVRQIGDLRPTLARVRAEGRAIGFVPTMGALHEGHLSLIRESRRREDFVVVSVYVNPRQFAPSEDLARYPRALERDGELAQRAGCDLFFCPSDAEIYPSGFATTVDVSGLSALLEGASRPGHFQGVATIVLKLFHLVEPTRAYFGEKDAQQLAVVRRLVTDLNLPVEIVAMPTVREPDGLAMSSRNAYLSEAERLVARRVPAALAAARAAIAQGERSPIVVREIVEEALGRESGIRVDYIAAVDPETFALLPSLRGEVRVLVAVRVGATRLIDNVRVRVGEAAR
jgi:pantoate--beta-alanine ligase